MLGDAVSSSRAVSVNPADPTGSKVTPAVLCHMNEHVRVHNWGEREQAPSCHV